MLANKPQKHFAALGLKFVSPGDDIRPQPLIERKTVLKWVLRKARGHPVS